ncbi:hypothetical protein B9Z19DRAFT_1093080 [Tuber borchii]|uniref:Uncharacterized protein n=1 Tax=Tuber borchii TaxID=42251 RepID=A0A2T6ZFR0_TUBBO|nr:hypothetical protein B9Z19DRAFT_1093080 [Tuber borchii]
MVREKAGNRWDICIATNNALENFSDFYSPSETSRNGNKRESINHTSVFSVPPDLLIPRTRLFSTSSSSDMHHLPKNFRSPPAVVQDVPSSCAKYPSPTQCSREVVSRS